MTLQQGIKAYLDDTSIAMNDTDSKEITKIVRAFLTKKLEDYQYCQPECPMLKDIFKDLGDKTTK